MNAVAWFYGQSFNGGTRQSKPKMEAESAEVFASCGHPVEIRFPVGATLTDKTKGFAEVISEPCSFCADTFGSRVDKAYENWKERQ